MSEKDYSKLSKVAKNINILLERKKITPKELAKQAKIPITTLMPIIKGTRDFRFSSLLSIATALEVSVETLIDGTYQPT
jgi:predicted transcriptional regulator